jgi:hypothetical protein
LEESPLDLLLNMTLLKKLGHQFTHPLSLHQHTLATLELDVHQPSLQSTLTVQTDQQVPHVLVTFLLEETLLQLSKMQLKSPKLLLMFSNTIIPLLLMMNSVDQTMDWTNIEMELLELLSMLSTRKDLVCSLNH